MLYQGRNWLQYTHPPSKEFRTKWSAHLSSFHLPIIIIIIKKNTAVSTRALGKALSQHAVTKDSRRECNSKYMLNIQLK